MLVGAPRKVVGRPMAPTWEVSATVNFDDDGQRFGSDISDGCRRQDPSAMQGQYIRGQVGTVGW